MALNTVLCKTKHTNIKMAALINFFILILVFFDILFLFQNNKYVFNMFKINPHLRNMGQT